MTIEDVIALLPKEIKERDSQNWFIGPDGKRWGSLEVAGWNNCLKEMLIALKPE